MQRIYERVLASLTPFGDDCWTTPIANEAEKCGNHNEGLRGQAARGDTWPTPTSRDHKDGGFCENVEVNALLGRAVWLTPNKSDGERGPDYAKADREGAGGDDLVTTTCRDAGSTGSLNPDWVETLLGYPISYTRPEGPPMTELPGVWPDGGWPTPTVQDAANAANATANRSNPNSRHHAGVTLVDATRWPAGLGAPQHDWEPPRLTTVKENRANRLKALGNSIAPEVARRILAAIVEVDDSEGR